MADGDGLEEELDNIFGLNTDAEPDVDTADEPAPGDLIICGEVTDSGEVCGEGPFPDKMRLGLHRKRVHGIAGKNATRSTSPKAKRGRSASNKDSAPTRRKTTPKPLTDPIPDSNRAVIYTQSIAMAALMAHLAIPRFDQFDLEVVNNGAPNLGAALDQVGAENPTVRKTCDLILGGGSGGAYLSLLLAASAIAMPIMAHHGVVPDSTGARFGNMLDGNAVNNPPGPEASADSAPPVARDQSPGLGDPSTWTAEELMAVMQQVPQNVFADLGSKMMSGRGPTVVGVPFTATPWDPRTRQSERNLNVVQSSPPRNPSPFPRRKDVPPAPRVDWYTWRNWFAREWKQDEHLTIIGPTGSGKSALVLDLLKIRSFKVFVWTKPADPKLQTALLRQNYVQVPAFPKNPPDDIDKYLLWVPGSGGLERAAQDRQRVGVHDALVKIFGGPPGGLPGRWCVTMDEARYVADPSMLGLRRDINLILIQGRSIRLSLVLLFQRPAWVPAEAYDQASHLFIANDSDRRNVQRFREIGGVDGETVAATVQGLGQYEWAHIDARPGQGQVQVVKMPKGL